MVKRRATRTKAVRTTLSLRADLVARLHRIADARGVSMMEVVRQGVESFADAADETERGTPAARARQLVDATRLLDNPYQKMVAAWRLDRAWRQMSEVVSYRLDLEAWPAEIYLLKVLTDLLHRFGPMDEFLVCTDVGFWTTSGVLGPESGTLYLAAQKQAVINGMRLVRVFLHGVQDPATGEKPESSTEAQSKQILEIHKQFLLDLAKAKAQNPRMSFDVMLRKFQGDGKSGIRQFACIRRRHAPFKDLDPNEEDGGCMVVEPVYDQEGKITHLHLLLSRGSGQSDGDVKFFLDRFHHAREGAVPIAQPPESS